MRKYKKNLKRFLRPKVIIPVFIFLLISFMWFKYIAGVILVAVFAPLAFMTVRYSKMIPHISIESNTSTSCLMGYMFGPVFGFFYGLIVGGVAYIGNSFVSATYLTTVLLGAVAGGITGVLGMVNVQFSHAFLIAITVRTIIAWPVFGLLGADPFERLTHQTSQFFSNAIIYLPLLSALYDIIKPFV